MRQKYLWSYSICRYLIDEKLKAELYINDREVIAKADGKVDDELHFGEFGTPIDFEDKLYTEGVETFDFQAGTHILSIPISNPTDYNVQYEIHTNQLVLQLHHMDKEPTTIVEDVFYTLIQKM